jgi:hypothetical protein
MYEIGTIEDALTRVRAPEELWRRIQQSRAPRASHRMRRLAWAVAAAMTFAGIAWNLPRPEFRSDDPAAIRAWVKERAGIDLPFAAHSGPARITGVRLKRNGVEVAYRAGDRGATFSIERARGSETPHWSAGGRSYGLACVTPGDLEAACGLCHI